MGLYFARSFDFKAKDCDELKGLDIGFAIKEYLQNSVGQILKALEVRVWRDWVREDLTADIPGNIRKRRECKKTLVQETPQIFAGEQGRYLKRSPSAQPLYVLQKCIPPSQRRQEPKDDEWFNNKLDRTFRRRVELGFACASDDRRSPDTARNQNAIVREDEVCIQVIGLPATLTPETAFAGVYGVAEQPLAWNIPNTDFELFEADSKFYHRDQLVPIEGPLGGLGVNFHGELRLTADRSEIVQNHVLFRRYRVKLQEALDTAIQLLPELAIRILDSFLSAPNGRFSPRPTGTENGDQYRRAFEAVCRARRPDLFESGKSVFPYSCRRSREDEPILHELSYVPWPLQDWQLDVLEAAGAYASPVQVSEAMFLGSPKMVRGELAGADLFQKLVCQIGSPIPPEVSIVKYPYSTPRCITRDGQVFLARPRPCIKCRTDQCDCWIGPALIRVIETSGGGDADLERVFEVYDQGRGVRAMPLSKPSGSRNSSVDTKADEESFSYGLGDLCPDSPTDVSDMQTVDDDDIGMVMDIDGSPDIVSVRCCRKRF